MNRHAVQVWSYPNKGGDMLYDYGIVSGWPRWGLQEDGIRDHQISELVTGIL